MPETDIAAVEDNATGETIQDDDNVLADCITRKQLLVQLDVHDATLRRWHRNGEAPPRIMLGGREYYHVPTTRKWVLSRLQRRGARDRQ